MLTCHALDDWYCLAFAGTAHNRLARGVLPGIASYHTLSDGLGLVQQQHWRMGRHPEISRIKREQEEMQRRAVCVCSGVGGGGAHEYLQGRADKTKCPLKTDVLITKNIAINSKI